MAKERLDVLLLELGLVDTRAKAQALIIAGRVLVKDEPQIKPGEKYDRDQVIQKEISIRIKGELDPYVARSAHKLLGALLEFKISVHSRTGLDIGASTGGFTQVLLEQGAKKVIALDVGHNQLDWKIRKDARVQVIEGVNARDMPFDVIGQKVDLIVVDVSFISLTKILQNLRQFSDADTDWITLVKPQFEVGREKLSKGGIVRNVADQMQSVREVEDFGKSIGLQPLGLVKSSITGTTGNQEYLIHWKIKNPSLS